MRDRDFDEVSRIQDEMDKARNPLRDVHEALNSVERVQSVNEAIQEMERHKAEAWNPALYADTQEIIRRISADEQYRNMTEDLASAVPDSQMSVTQRALQGLDLSALRGINEEVAVRFSLLSTQEALAGALQESLHQTPDAFQDAIRNANAAAGQIANLSDSPGFDSALDGIKGTLTETLEPATLASARYLATENLLQRAWPDADAWESIRNSVPNLQTDLSDALRQAQELALDPRVREMLAQVSSQDLIENAAELLYQEDFTVEQAEGIVHFGIDSEALTSLSPQTMRKFRELVVSLLIVLFLAQLNPEFASYAKQFEKPIMTLAALYGVLVTQRHSDKESRDEDE